MTSASGPRPATRRSTPSSRVADRGEVERERLVQLVDDQLRRSSTSFLVASLAVSSRRAQLLAQVGHLAATAMLSRAHRHGGDEAPLRAAALLRAGAMDRLGSQFGHGRDHRPRMSLS